MKTKRTTILILAVLVLCISTISGCATRSVKSTAFNFPSPIILDELRTDGLSRGVVVPVKEGEFILLESGYKRNHDVDLTKEDYIMQICRITAEGEAEYITTISGCNVDSSAFAEPPFYVGDSIIYVKSHVPMPGDEFKGEIVAIDMETYAVLWRYPIDRNLAYLRVIGDHLIVSDCYEFTETESMLSGMRRPDVNNMKTRVLLGKNGEIVAQTVAGFGIMRTAQMVGDTFYGIGYDSGENLNGCIFEMNRNLEVLRTFAFPQGVTLVDFYVDECKLISTGERTAVILATDAMYSISESGVELIAEATGILANSIIRDDQYYIAASLVSEQNAGGAYGMVLMCTKPQGERSEKTSMLYVEYDIAGKQVKCSSLYPEHDFNSPEAYTKDADGKLTALSYAGKNEFKITKWG